MADFTPDFSKSSNYDSKSGYTQIRFGFGSPLLEVELNELQEIQSHFRKNILLNLYGGKNGLKEGSFTYDKVAYKLKYENLVLLIEGDFYDLGNGELDVTPNQSIIISNKSVTVDGTTTIYAHGKQDGEVIDNKIIDERVMNETSRREQMQFVFELVDGANVELKEGQSLFGYVDMSGEFTSKMEEITVESATSIAAQKADSLLVNFPVGASNFAINNVPAYDALGDLIAVGDAEQMGYRFPANAKDYTALNVVTEKFGNGYATQYAYTDSGQVFYREAKAGASNFGEWQQLIDGKTFTEYQEKADKRVLDLTMEVAILSSATSSGVDSNIVIETFKTLDDVNLIKGKYDAENRRVYLSYTV